MQACFANKAWLNNSNSLKFSLPSFFRKHKFSHLNQWIISLFNIDNIFKEGSTNFWHIHTE